MRPHRNSAGVEVAWVPSRRREFQGELRVTGGPELASLAVAAELACRLQAGGISAEAEFTGDEVIRVAAATPVDLRDLERVVVEVLARHWTAVRRA